MVIRSDAELLRKSENTPTEERLGFGVFSFLNKSLATPSNMTRQKEAPADVIWPPSSRPMVAVPNKVRTSRPYRQNALKEPGYELEPPMAISRVEDASIKSHLHHHSKHPHNQEDVVRELLQDLHSMENTPPHEEVIQPSANTSERLSRIIGRPCDRVYSCVDTKYVDDRKSQAFTSAKPNSTNQRLSSRRRPHWRSPSLSANDDDDDDDQTECGSSVATVSDLDILAAKSLRPKMSRQANSLSVLREEIKEMVVGLDGRDAKETLKLTKTRTEANGDREASDTGTKEKPNKPRNHDDTNESCTMMWCKGPPTVERFLNDMKQMIVCAATENM